MVVMKDSFDSGLRMLSEMARRPAFAQAEIERQQQQTVSGLSVSLEDPDYVADAFSAMTTDRPYRKALGWDIAISEIRKGIGTQFDPEMARAFLAAVSKRRPPGKSSPLQLVTDDGYGPSISVPRELPKLASPLKRSLVDQSICSSMMVFRPRVNSTSMPR